MQFCYLQNVTADIIKLSEIHLNKKVALIGLHT